jgi:AraC-like DNA-binding protein
MNDSFDVAATYARLILRSQLLPREELLARTGVTAQYLMSADYVDWRVLATMFQNIDSTAAVSAAWAAHLGGQFNVSAHGPLGFAALSAPTLGSAFEVLVELSSSRVTALSVELESTRDSYVMRIHDVTGDDQFACVVAEIVLKVAESLLAAIFGYDVTENVLISLKRPQPQDPGEFYSAFNASLIFGASEHSISIPASWWRLPSPLYDESTYWANVAKCRELIASREQLGSAALIVRTHLRNHFDRQIAGSSEQRVPPTLVEVAQAMHLTRRTLIRRLAKDDCSYRQILEDLRREYAQSLLGNARLTVAAVGELLGYGEPANFGRAFRRWFGRSPASWRHESAAWPP